MGNRIIKGFMTGFAVLFFMCLLKPTEVKAQLFLLPDGSVFDSDFYASVYTDVQAVYGFNPDKLYQHYLKNGIKEGRMPSAYTMYNQTTARSILPVYMPPVWSAGGIAQIRNQYPEYNALFDPWEQYPYYPYTFGSYPMYSYPGIPK